MQIKKNLKDNDNDYTTEVRIESQMHEEGGLFPTVDERYDVKNISIRFDPLDTRVNMKFQEICMWAKLDEAILELFDTTGYTTENNLIWKGEMLDLEDEDEMTFTFEKIV